MDVIFALGSMGSSALELFERQKNVTSSKIDKQTFQDTKYGVIVYGDRAKTHLAIKNDLNNDQVKTLVEELAWVSDGTQINLALTRARGIFVYFFFHLWGEMDIPHDSFSAFTSYLSGDFFRIPSLKSIQIKEWIGLACAVLHAIPFL